MNTIFLKITALAFVLTCIVGCSPDREAADKTDSKPPVAQGRDILDIDPDVTSLQVLSTVPNTGLFKKIMQQKKIRFALQGEDEPFQVMHPDLGKPTGFNVALAEQIARVFNAAAEISMTNESHSRNEMPEVDIKFVIDNAGACEPDATVKYFYDQSKEHWLSLCVTGSDPALKLALESTLDYFTETGVFTYLYTEYF